MAVLREYTVGGVCFIAGIIAAVVGPKVWETAMIAFSKPNPVAAAPDVARCILFLNEYVETVKEGSLVEADALASILPVCP